MAVSRGQSFEVGGGGLPGGGAESGVADYDYKAMRERVAMARIWFEEEICRQQRLAAFRMEVCEYRVTGTKQTVISVASI